MNTSDSIMFLTAARQALSETILASNTADPDYVSELSDFVVNEASDYQVMALLMDQDLPEEQINFEEESKLFEQYKDAILENFPVFSEAFGEDTCHSILYEVGPVSQHGIDTAAPLLEAYIEEKNVNKSKIAAVTRPARNLKKGMKKGAAGKELRGSAASSKMAKTGEKIGQKYTASKSALKAAPGRAKDAIKSGVSKTTSAIKNAPKNIKNAPKNMKDAAGRFKRGKAVGKVNPNATSQSRAGRAGLQVGKAQGKLAAASGKEIAKGAAKGLGAAAVAAAAIYGGYKVYKNFLSKAARACKGSENKQACMQQHKNKALQAQISAVRSGASKCSTAKDPAKCKAAITAKLQKLQGKIKK